MIQPPHPLQAPLAGVSRVVKLLLGSVGILIGLPCTLWIIVDIVRGPNHMGAAVLLICFSALLLLLGVLSFRSGLRAGAPVAAPMAWMTQEMEREILRAAERRGGMLTIGQLALETPLNVSQCDEALRQLERQGAVRSDVGLDGAIYYHFLGLGGGAASQVVFDTSTTEAHAQQQASARGEDGRW